MVSPWRQGHPRETRRGCVASAAHLDSGGGGSAKRSRLFQWYRRGRGSGYGCSRSRLPTATMLQQDGRAEKLRRLLVFASVYREQAQAMTQRSRALISDAFSPFCNLGGGFNTSERFLQPKPSSSSPDPCQTWRMVLLEDEGDERQAPRHTHTHTSLWLEECV